MQKVIGLALVVGLLTFAGSAFLLNTMQQRIPAVVHYPIVNGIAAAAVALVIGLLAIIANNGRPRRPDDHDAGDHTVVRERLQRHVPPRD